MDGHAIRRPAKNHPNDAHWQQLRVERRQLQTVGGQVHCGTCWHTSDGSDLDLHHRHYNTWGAERLSDVVLLCRPCHEAITSRIRFARYAAGDKTVSVDREVVTEKRVRFEGQREIVVTQRETAVEPPRFRPPSR